MQSECDRVLIGRSHDEVERYGREVIPLRRNARSNRVHAHVHKVFPPVARRGDKEDEHCVREVVEGAKRGIEPISGHVRVVSGAELLLEKALRMQSDGSGRMHWDGSVACNGMGRGACNGMGRSHATGWVGAHATGWVGRMQRDRSGACNGMGRVACNGMGRVGATRARARLKMHQSSSALISAHQRSSEVIQCTCSRKGMDGSVHEPHRSIKSSMPST